VVLKYNSKNPRIITDEAIDQAVSSIIQFPEMMALNPIVHYKGVIYAGEVRHRALQKILDMPLSEVKELIPQERVKSIGKFWKQALSSKEFPNDWVKEVDFEPGLLDEFMIKDNVHSGQWDYSVLANVFDSSKLRSWGVKIFWGNSEHQNSEGATAPETKFEPSLAPTSDKELVQEKEFEQAQRKIEEPLHRAVVEECTECPNCKYQIHYSI